MAAFKPAYNPTETYIAYFTPESGLMPHHFPKDEVQRARIERLFKDKLLDIRGADEPAPAKKKQVAAIDMLLEKNIKQKKELADKDAEIEALKKQLAKKDKKEPKEPILVNEDDITAECKKLKEDGISLVEIGKKFGLTINEVRKRLK